MNKFSIVTVILLSTTMVQGFDFGSVLNTATQTLQNSNSKTTNSKHTTTSATSSLSNATVANGLKSALSNGVSYAISNLSKSGGYLDNSLVKIPLPKNLSKAETIVRKAGGGKYADNLITSMNTAASKAVPKTAVIFADAIKKMSLDDAKKILAGGDDAATQYFKNSSSKSLQNAIKPIIQDTMKENKVASYYSSFNEYYKKYAKGLVDSSGAMSMAKSFGVDEYLPSSSDEKLDDYVTKKAIDGLFKMIASKEEDIRKNPLAQTTSLLKQVFGK